MKKYLALGLALMTSAGMAQTYINEDEASYSGDQQIAQPQEQTAAGTTAPLANPGNRHMFEFGLESIESLALSFDKIKTKGQTVDSGSNIDLDVNYAYGVHRLIQAGVRFNYFTGIQGSEDQENLGLSFGVIFNHMADFQNAAYLSLYLGGGWAQQFGDNASRDDLRFGLISIGKRWSLEPFGIKHVTYSPEVSFKATNSTTDESLDYSQSLQFKILQFSVFF